MSAEKYRRAAKGIKVKQENHRCVQVGAIAALIEHSRQNIRNQKTQNGTLQQIKKDLHEVGIKLSRIDATLKERDRVEDQEIGQERNALTASGIRFDQWGLRIAVAAVIIHFFSGVLWPIAQHTWEYLVSWLS